MNQHQLVAVEKLLPFWAWISSFWPCGPSFRFIWPCGLSFLSFSPFQGFLVIPINAKHFKKNEKTVFGD